MKGCIFRPRYGDSSLPRKEVRVEITTRRPLVAFVRSVIGDRISRPLEEENPEVRCIGRNRTFRIGQCRRRPLIVGTLRTDVIGWRAETK